MGWFVILLFASMPLLGLWSAWQAFALLSGRPTAVSKRLDHLPEDGRASATRHYGYLAATFAAALIALPVLSVANRWAFPIWGQLLTIVSGCAAIWGWWLQRRFGASQS